MEIRTAANLRASADRLAAPHPAAHAWLRMTGLIAASMAYAVTALAQVTMPDPAVPLRDRYTALSVELEQSPLQRGLYLESVESSRSLRGDIYAVVDYPFATISDALTIPESWCEALILHLNVKYCQTACVASATCC